MSGPLLDDCFAHDRRRLTAAEALERLRASVGPVVAPETVALADACGRFLAEPVISPRAVPGFDNVAVDGYACAHADLSADEPTRLRLIEGRAAAGHPFAATLPAGAALRVLTGAALPAGADTVLMQEDCERVEGAVVLPPGVKRGANRRLAGEDMGAGQVVLEPGRRLRPQDVGVAAAVGRASLQLYRPLRVALLSTGDELVEPGTALAPGATYDANRPILAALLHGLGCTVTDLGIVADQADLVDRTITAAAAGHDAIITSGGASRGDEDHVVRAIERLGRLHFWQIAVKPGRPLAFGQVGSCVFAGLPGNPVAAVICFLRFARPVLTALGGGRWPEPHGFTVAAGFAMTKKPERREYLRARLITNDAGQVRAEKITREGSGILTSLTEADGLVELDEAATAVAVGDPVVFVPFSEFGIVP